MPSSRTPIAVFAYKRPKHLSVLLQSLYRCGRLDSCQVNLYFDAAKQTEDRSAVEETRRVGAEWAERLGAKMIFRDANLGLTKSIVGTVSELCNQYGRAIVLEDDLQCAPDFVEFLLSALDRYENEKNVFQISGYMYPIRTSFLSDGLFMPFTSCWGWAVWERSWKRYDPMATGAREAMADPKRRYRFDVWGSYPYSTMLLDALDGKIPSWGILWQWSVHQNEGSVLYPRKSLIWNAGFDGSGMNAGNPMFDRQPFDLARRVLPEPIRLPSTIRVDGLAMKRLSRLLRRQQNPGAYTVRGRVNRLLKKILRA